MMYGRFVFTKGHFMEKELNEKEKIYIKYITYIQSL